MARQRTSPWLRLPRRRRLALAAALLPLAGCGAGGPARLAWQDLDPATGATVTRVAEPLLFFQDDPARAANARDYMHLAPFEVSQGGRHSGWLWLALWSTIDRGVTDGEPAVPEVTAIRLVVDGEPMELDLGAAVTTVPGAGQGPYAAPVSTASIMVLPLSASQLARLGRAATVGLAVERAGQGERAWSLWSGSPAQLGAIAGLLVAPDPAGSLRRP